MKFRSMTPKTLIATLGRVSSPTKSEGSIKYSEFSVVFLINALMCLYPKPEAAIATVR